MNSWGNETNMNVGKKALLYICTERSHNETKAEVTSGAAFRFVHVI